MLGLLILLLLVAVFSIGLGWAYRRPDDLPRALRWLLGVQLMLVVSQVASGVSRFFGVGPLPWATLHRGATLLVTVICWMLFPLAAALAIVWIRRRRRLLGVVQLISATAVLVLGFLARSSGELAPSASPPQGRRLADWLAGEFQLWHMGVFPAALAVYLIAWLAVLHYAQPRDAAVASPARRPLVVADSGNPYRSPAPPS